MENKHKAWLTHLINVVPIEARRNRTSMYTIALEGWRRGLKLRFYNLTEYNKLQIRYSLTYKGRERHFDGSSGDMVTEEAFHICEDKSITYQYLSKAGVPIPKGRAFGPEATEKEIIYYAEKIRFPLVVKPTNGSGGKGVFANLKNTNELKEALYYVREVLKFENILVEQFVTGDEVRIYVLDGKILGAVNRRPASVIGDGTHSIRKLVEMKNESRKKVPHLYFRPIKIDKNVHELIQSAGYTLDSIPKKGERIYLKRVSNISLGGDPIDVTEELTPAQQSIALKAANSIPGLKHCGLDMIIDHSKNKSVILEVNTRPGIGSHLFPIEGKSRDIPKAIIDYYFPETKHIDTSNSNVMFDFRDILEPLQGRSIREVNVRSAKKASLYAQELIIDLDIDLEQIYLNVKDLADKQSLSGFMRRDHNRIAIIIAGECKRNIGFFKQQLVELLKKYGQVTIQTKDWDGPIKIGFHLEKGVEFLSLRELEEKVRILEREYKQVNREIMRLRHRIKLMEESRSWRLANFIRNRINVIKKTVVRNDYSS